MRQIIQYVCLSLLLTLFPLWAEAQEINLAGTWRFAIDREDRGIAQQWFNRTLSDEVTLPGSMMTNGKGDPVDLQTPWMGSRVDSAFFKEDRYAPFRRADNFKVPFWLQPNTYYAGVAWYQREVEIPASWQGKTVLLDFERCHWESRLWVDGKEVGMQNALSAPQSFDLTDYLTPGKHTLSVRVDNRVGAIDPGENSHSISDHTQGNWNGIAGKMRLSAREACYVGHLATFPRLSQRTLLLKAEITNRTGQPRTAELAFCLQEGKELRRSCTLQPGTQTVTFTLPLPAGIDYWDEFHPNLYRLSYALRVEGKETDRQETTFGCREWQVRNGVLTLNGKQAFLRGTLHCASFPLTGYPATDKAEWLREFQICKSYGINHIRFHSWCPPEAAFEAADELGLYCMVECSSWANQSSAIGNGAPIDTYIHDEAQRIIRAYGSHPSFCLFAYGNEPAGDKQAAYLTDFVNYWKTHDGRHLYTSAAGWPNLPVNDFLSDATPRIQGWGQGLKSIINAQAPATDYDWRQYTETAKQPYVSHEIGQWCVYPNFREMAKYTGVYKARNFEIFQSTLEAHGLGALADSFLFASGKLQTLCYKADIEAALRTPRFGGFQLLGLNDFPGQGTALVGTLDAFWEEKGYVTPEEYRRFCNSIVPLARMQRLVYDNDETFAATIEIANYQTELTRPDIRWAVRDADRRILRQGRFSAGKLAIGNTPVGEIRFALGEIREAAQLNLEVSVGTYHNDWNFWVYPATKEETLPEGILLTDRLDKQALDRLKAGGSVLLSLKQGSLKKEFGGDIAIGFSSIFWNTSWTNHQPPHTLGILCDPAHPALAAFPTAGYSDYQWWDAMSHSNAIYLGRIAKTMRPIVRVIDDWFTNRSLALLFEAQVAGGKLLVSGIDFHEDMANRPAARQLLHSLTGYMASEAFNPSTPLSAETIMQLTD